MVTAGVAWVAVRARSALQSPARRLGNYARGHALAVDTTDGDASVNTVHDGARVTLRSWDRDARESGMVTSESARGWSVSTPVALPQSFLWDHAAVLQRHLSRATEMGVAGVFRVIDAPGTLLFETQEPFSAHRFETVKTRLVEAARRLDPHFTDHGDTVVVIGRSPKGDTCNSSRMLARSRGASRATRVAFDPVAAVRALARVAATPDMQKACLTWLLEHDADGPDVPALIQQGLESSDPRHRTLAARAYQGGGRDALDSLIEVVVSGVHPNVPRYEALEALVRLPAFSTLDNEALGQLAVALEEVVATASGDLLAALLDKLDRVFGHQLPLPLLGSRYVSVGAALRQELVRQMSLHGQAAEKDLLRAVDDDDGIVRSVALGGLAAHGTGRSLGSLQRIRANWRVPTEERYLAAEAIDRIRQRYPAAESADGGLMLADETEGDGGLSVEDGPAGALSVESA